MCKLAIVIPYYKKKYVEQTLKSLLNQTDKRFTVYLGNDASPEPIDDLLAVYQVKLNLKYHTFSSNLGGEDLAGQWERCLNMVADEEWFMVLGDDDYLDENVVAQFYENLTEIIKHDISVVKFKSTLIDEFSNVLSVKKDVLQIKSAWDHFFDKFVFEGRSSLSEHIFKTAMYHKYKFKSMPLAWHSDDLAQLEFSVFGNIYYIPHASVFVRFSIDNISGQQESIAVKRKASAFFYNYLVEHMRNYNQEHLIKFIQLIEWAQKDKKFNVAILPLLIKYIEAYGVNGVIKLLKYKIKG